MANNTQQTATTKIVLSALVLSAEVFKDAVLVKGTVVEILAKTSKSVAVKIGDELLTIDVATNPSIGSAAVGKYTVTDLTDDVVEITVVKQEKVKPRGVSGTNGCDAPMRNID